MTQDDAGSAPMLGSQQIAAGVGGRTCSSEQQRADDNAKACACRPAASKVVRQLLSTKEIHAITYAAGTIENENIRPEIAAVLWRLVHRATWGD